MSIARNASIAACITAFLLSHTSLAWARGAETLIGDCRVLVREPRNDRERQRALYCLGVMHGFRIGTAAAEKPWICIPKKVTPKQLAAIYLKWADQNPTTWHLHESLTLSRASYLAFPCRRDK